MATWIDRRWVAQHRIGHHPTKLYSRLTVEAQDVPITGPTSPGPAALKAVPKGLIYSPGYNAMARAERELLTI